MPSLAGGRRRRRPPAAGAVGLAVVLSCLCAAPGAAGLRQFEEGNEDPLPYAGAHWGARRGAALAAGGGGGDNPSYESFPVDPEDAGIGWQHDSERNGKVYTRVMVKDHDDGSAINGMLYVVKGGPGHFSVLPPLNGCGHGAFTPDQSARGRCLVATNAGFFDTKTPRKTCHGTLVSEGVVENESDEMNVSFGVTEDGDIVVGYLTEGEKKKKKFRQLVNGVVWLVRNGTAYVADSLRNETMETQESGCDSVDNCYFRSVKAPRLSVGHDAYGRILILAMDGQPGFSPRWGGWVGRTGVDLDQMAELMLKAGAVNAINLDGGGSVSVYEDGVLVNSPTDECPKDTQEAYPFRQGCVRPVTSILCIHDTAPQPVEPGTPVQPPPPVPPPSPRRTGTWFSDPSVALALVGGAIVVSLMNFVLFCTKWFGPPQDGAKGLQPSGRSSAPTLPAYRSRGPMVKKLRKKRGGARYQRAEIDFELHNLPATGYDSDSPTELQPRVDNPSAQQPPTPEEAKVADEEKEQLFA
ncbi:SPBc2 prophage-derived uncharacterized protein YomE [Diplonema papillatum]|nr:SPBc2 prophage-derived uncharacterized protein YomE [Diplonema papillatum]